VENHRDVRADNVGNSPVILKLKEKMGNKKG
jgi:hypothetical protein